MTVRLLYFAWVRERIGLGEEEIALSAPMVLGDLVRMLSARSPAHALALGELEPLRAACNDAFVGWDHQVRPGDEIAIFPPVTGG